VSEKNEPEAQSAYGCEECGLLVDLHVFHWGDEGEAAPVSFCPICGKRGLTFIPTLPYIVEDDAGDQYLMDSTGVTTGPYTTEKEAQECIWAWLEEKHHGEEEEGHQEDEAQGARKGIKLVVSNGKVLRQKGARKDTC